MARVSSIACPKIKTVKMGTLSSVSTGIHLRSKLSNRKLWLKKTLALTIFHTQRRPNRFIESIGLLLCYVCKNIRMNTIIEVGNDPFAHLTLDNHLINSTINNQVILRRSLTFDIERLRNIVPCMIGMDRLISVEDVMSNQYLKKGTSWERRGPPTWRGCCTSSWKVIRS